MKVLVTGASGFLGGRLSKALHEEGHEVIALSRSKAREIEFKKLGISSFSGNPYTQVQLSKLLKEVKMLVHCAALSSPWATYQDFFTANVALSQQLLDAAITAGVKRFINISSPSIYFEFKDKLDIREDAPLPGRFVNAYAETKFLAESNILDKHGKGIETISLRPRAIIGAEDAVLFPRLMKAYKTGRLRVIGKGKNLADFTSVVNLISAIQLCMKAPVSACGQTYNISNGKPDLLWEEINYLIERLGHSPISKSVPYPIARALAFVLEQKSKLTSGNEPKLTQYGVGVLAKSFSLDISRAKELLDYQPIMTTRQALDEFLAWYTKQL